MSMALTMFRFGRALLGSVRRHRRLLAAAVLLLLLAGILGGYLWTGRQFRLAEQALHDDHLQEAHDRIGWCLSVWPWSARTQFLAARIERHRGNYPQAERHLNEFARLGGDGDAAQVEWVLQRAQTGDLDEVQVALWNCIRQDHPATTEILATLARTYMEVSRISPALDCLNRWIERDPSAPQAWFWRAWARARMQQTEEAIQDYQHALELAPDQWDARLRLSIIFLENRKPAEALPHLQFLARNHPENPEVLVALARCYVLQGNEEEAEKLVETVLADNADADGALVLRAMLACQKGKPEVGEVWLRKAIALRPSNHDALYQLYTCLQQQSGRDREAAEVLKRHEAAVADMGRLRTLLQVPLERTPHDATIISEVGELWLRLGEEKIALDWLYRALKENPQHALTHEVLARHFESKGQKDKAAEHRQALLQLKPSNASPPKGPPQR
jgi:tetratricopeptide (TPR) repeat protein